LGLSSPQNLVEHSGLEQEQAQQALNALIDQGVLIHFSEGRMVLPRVSFERVKQDIITRLQEYHQNYPLRAGMPRERLKSQMALNTRDFDGMLAHLSAAGILVESGADLWLSQHQINFTAEQKAQIEGLMKAFEAQPFTPPSYKYSREAVGEELLNSMLALGKLVRIGEDVLFLPQVVAEMRQAVISHIQNQGSITLAELRDQFDTSRKYAVAVLEYLDQTGVTVRRDDARVLTKHFAP